MIPVKTHTFLRTPIFLFTDLLLLRAHSFNSLREPSPFRKINPHLADNALLDLHSLQFKKFALWPYVIWATYGITSRKDASSGRNTMPGYGRCCMNQEFERCGWAESGGFSSAGVNGSVKCN